jgi:hypothetical protein
MRARLVYRVRSVFHAERCGMLNSLLDPVERQNSARGDGGGGGTNATEPPAGKLKHTPDSSAIKIIGLFRPRSGARCERCISKLVGGDTNNANWKALRT